MKGYRDEGSCIGGGNHVDARSRGKRGPGGGGGTIPSMGEEAPFGGPKLGPGSSGGSRPTCPKGGTEVGSGGGGSETRNKMEFGEGGMIGGGCHMGDMSVGRRGIGSGGGTSPSMGQEASFGGPKLGPGSIGGIGGGGPKSLRHGEGSVAGGGNFFLGEDSGRTNHLFKNKEKQSAIFYSSPGEEDGISSKLTGPIYIHMWINKLKLLGAALWKTIFPLSELPESIKSTSAIVIDPMGEGYCGLTQLDLRKIDILNERIRNEIR